MIYENSKERAYVSQKVLKKNTFEPSTDRSSSYGPTMARLRQPFTKKKFVEDI